MNYRKIMALVVSLGIISAGFAGCSKPVDTSSVNSSEEITTEASNETAGESKESDEADKIEAYNDFFVTSSYVKENIGKENFVIIDARGEDEYNKGHIIGSRPVSWQSLSNMSVEFATPDWGSVVDKDLLEKGIQNLGIKKESEVIVYADTKKGWGEEGRIYWTLKIAGIENVKMLDGGYNIWTYEKNETTKDKTEVSKSEFVIDELNLSKSINTEALASNLNDYKVVDTRDLDEYNGAVKFGEARGGNIPGSTWISYKSLLNSDGTLKSKSELEEIFTMAGLDKDDKIATYCTAGIRSAYMALVLEMLDYKNVVNYDESFYVWANDKNLKVGRSVNDKSYNYYTAENLKNSIESNNEIILVDIQVKEDFEKHHIMGATQTNAYPVKSDEDIAKLNDVLLLAKENTKDVVIVCPRGAGGAERTFDFFIENGVQSSRLYVLENGQAGWEYEELLEK